MVIDDVLLCSLTFSVASPSLLPPVLAITIGSGGNSLLWVLFCLVNPAW